MTDIYKLAIGLDTTAAQSGAKDMQAALRKAGASAEYIQKHAAELNQTLVKTEPEAKRAARGVEEVAKQYGFAAGKIKEFSKFGATVFAGEILARTLGFGSVLGIVGKASELAADGLASIGRAVKAAFFGSDSMPAGAKAATEGVAQLRQEVERLNEAARGPGLKVDFSRYGVGSFKSTSGLDAKAAAEYAKQIADDQAAISHIATGGGAKASGGGFRLFVQSEDEKRQARYDEREREGFFNQFVAEREAAQNTLLARLRDETKERERLLEVEKQRAALEKQRQDLDNKAMTATMKERQLYADAIDEQYFGGGKQSSASRDAEANRERYGSEAAQRAKDESNALAQESVEFARRTDPSVIGGAIQSAFRNSAEIIARAFGGTPGGGVVGPDFKVGIPGSERDKYGAEAANARAAEEARGNAEIWAQHRADQLWEEYLFQKEKHRIAEDAKKVFNDSIGFRIAEGFEEAILSGQKLSDVLKQLLQDLIRMVFKQNVTNHLAAAITKGLFGPAAAPGGQSVTGGGTATAPQFYPPGAGEGGDSSSMHGGRAVIVNMTVNASDAKSFLQSKRQIGTAIRRMGDV